MMPAQDLVGADHRDTEAMSEENVAVFRQSKNINDEVRWAVRRMAQSRKSRYRKEGMILSFRELL